MGVYMQARVVEVLTAGPSTAESVNAFCKRFGVRRDIRKNLQVYFERLSKIPGTKPAGGLFSTLSPSLAQQVMLDVHEGWLHKLVSDRDPNPHPLPACADSTLADSLACVRCHNGCDATVCACCHQPFHSFLIKETSPWHRKPLIRHAATPDEPFSDA